MNYSRQRNFADLINAGISADDADTFQRISRSLHRLDEHSCNGYCNWLNKDQLDAIPHYYDGTQKISALVLMNARKKAYSLLRDGQRNNR